MVAEMHGVWANGSTKYSGQWISVHQEGEDGIAIKYPLTTVPVMTPQQARYLASKLNRLARLIEGGVKS
jgi:hypothetical protein